MLFKRFREWIGLKEILHNMQHRAPLVTEGEIWWASIGENIGSEINGKSRLFSRPVIIRKKLAHTFFLAIPTTTQQRTGSWYVAFRHKGKDMTACLHQTRAIDFRRLSSKLGELDNNDFKRVKDGLKTLYN